MGEIEGSRRKVGQVDLDVLVRGGAAQPGLLAGARRAPSNYLEDMCGITSGRGCEKVIVGTLNALVQHTGELEVATPECGAIV